MGGVRGIILTFSGQLSWYIPDRKETPIPRLTICSRSYPLPVDSRILLWGWISAACTSQDFLPQFRENLGKTREFFQILLHALED